MISATIMGIIAQRLVRTICTHCKKPRELSREERNYLQLPQKSHTVWEGEGCKECRNTGYKGRTGLFEVLDMSDLLKGMITNSVELSVLTATAREEGLVTLRQIAVRKMLEGITTYEEVVAVTG